MTSRKIIIGLLLAVIAALLLTCGAALSHGSTRDTTGPTNGLGVVIEHTNPNTSLVGVILSGQIIADTDSREATVLQVHPLETYGLFDESITFCGDQSDKVSTPEGNILRGPLVFIYRRAAARLIEGVPCFELKAVRSIIPEKPRFQ